ncbi:MAG TPA: lantibiotic dehydratase [Acidimicrobiales bacterium]|nr:lantibiotic dehydratase [Acidimicrobiales bacterium]
MTAVQVLSHAVLRVAAWPVEVADRFAAPDLAARTAALSEASAAAGTQALAAADALYAEVPGAGRAARRWLLAARRALHAGRVPPPAPAGVEWPAAADALAACAAEDAAVRALHDRILDDQAAELRRLAGDERFLRALAVEKPALYRRWAAALARPDRCRAGERRLEGAAFHHLMGAAGRPTPRGAWAGVAPVDPGDGPLRAEPAPARHEVTVALEPFAAVLDRWAEALIADPDVALRAAPTLFESDAGWRHEGRDGAWVEVAATPAHRAVLAFWVDGQPRPARPLLEFAAAEGGDAAAARVSGVVAALTGAGTLVSALALPTVAADPWAALDAVTPLLPEVERAAWAAAVASARAGCEELGRCFEALAHWEVAARSDAVAAAVARLWRAGGVPGEPPEPLVRLDFRAPWRATWDAAAREEAAAAVAEVLRFHAADGAAERYRRASPCPTGPAPALAARTPLVPPGAAHRRADALRARGCDPGDEAWEQALEPHHGSNVLRLDAAAEPAAGAGPAGSFLLLAGAGRWARWGRPQPGLFATRHAALLGGADGHLELLARLGAVQVWGADPAERTSALRPPAAAHLAADGLAGVALEGDGDGRVWVRRPGSEARELPVYDAATAVGRTDRCSALLLAAAMTHGWELVAWGFPLLGAEEERWHHLPRLVLPGGTVLSAERWLVPADVVARLRELRGWERYRAWREEAERRRLPALAFLRWEPNPTAPELLFPAESPLAVRALFDRLPAGAGPLVLTEVPEQVRSSPVVDGEGGHHVAELAVTWVREQ